MAADTRLELMRDRLIEERDRITTEAAAIAAYLPEYDGSPNDSRYGNHEADEATDIYEEEKALALHSHLTGMLDEIVAALERIDRGTYGICVNCGEPIDPERLEVLPWTPLCISCKTKRVAA